MFATLDNLEKELKQEVKKLEDKWDKEPKHDYHFHEICGINIAIDVVERFKSKTQSVTNEMVWRHSRERF